MARDDYELRRTRQRQGIDAAMKASRYKGGRKLNVLVHACAVALWLAGHTIKDTARLARCSIGTVKIAWAAHQVEQSMPAAPLQ